MALAITVYDEASPAIQRLAASMNPRETGAVAGRAVSNKVRAHLFDRDKTMPNRLAGKRTHFAAQAARSTQFRVVADGAVVSINHVGFRQRLEGGTILPTKGKYLTIPMRAEAHGKRAREFDDLQFAIVPGIGPALVKALQSEIRVGKRGVKDIGVAGGEVYYRLVKKVHQRADRTWLPTDAEMVGAARDALGTYFQRAVDRGRTR